MYCTSHMHDYIYSGYLLVERCISSCSYKSIHAYIYLYNYNMYISINDRNRTLKGADMGFIKDMATSIIQRTRTGPYNYIDICIVCIYKYNTYIWSKLYPFITISQ